MELKFDNAEDISFRMPLSEEAFIIQKLLTW